MNQTDWKLVERLILGGVKFFVRTGPHTGRDSTHVDKAAAYHSQPITDTLPDESIFWVAVKH